MIPCPCGHGEIDPRDFRAWLAQSQEARLHAAAVLKSQHFGGKPMRRVEKGGRWCLEVGTEPSDDINSVGDD